MTTVLVVEDDAIYRGALARALAREGFQPVEVDGVESACAYAASSKPAFAVIDLRLGDGSGIDVVRELARAAPHCKSVLLTGHGTIPAAVEAMRAGASDFRTKPISTAERVDALRRSADATNSGAPDPLGRAEREHILKMLDACNGNISEAARRLNLHRRTLQRKLQKLPPTG